MAARARDAAPIHEALHEIVALHAVFTRVSVREVQRLGLTDDVLVEAPEIGETHAGTEPNRPLEVLAVDRLRRVPFRMALHADIDRRTRIQSRGIHDVRARWALEVIAGRTVAPLAADVPFRHRLRCDV